MKEIIWFYKLNLLAMYEFDPILILPVDLLVTNSCLLGIYLDTNDWIYLLTENGNWVRTKSTKIFKLSRKKGDFSQYSLNIEKIS